MPYENLGGYWGLAKEATYGTIVAPTLFASLDNTLPKLTTDAPPGFISSPLTFGDTTAFPTTESAVFSADFVVTPKFIGMALLGLLGSVTSASNTHTFKYGLNGPGITAQVKDGVSVHNGAGMSFTELTLSHKQNDVLRASVSGIGKQRTVAGTAATPITETQQFYNQHLTVSVAGSVLTCTVEDLSLSIKNGKKIMTAVTSATSCGIENDGAAEITSDMTLRFDGVDRLPNFKSATAVALNFQWQIDASTSIVVPIASAVLTADPAERQNNDLGVARVKLSHKAVGFGGATIVTLKNSQASY